LKPGSNFSLFSESTKTIGSAMASCRLLPIHRCLITAWRGRVKVRVRVKVRGRGRVKVRVRGRVKVRVRIGSGAG